jgi:phosphoribosylanthranilate isomerase
MLVKICGITHAEDAACAVECGATALGFVFWPGSPRFIDAARAGAIVATLPPFVTPVGVFVNQTSDHVNGIAADARLGVIQLHGDEAPTAVDELNCPVLKAIALDRASDEAIDAWPARTMLLLDTLDPVRRGGTGRTGDWARASAVASRRPILLAGGLTPDNVVEAIARVRPFGVDVSSGVETSPGIKDHRKLRAFLAAVGQSQSSSLQRTP